MALLVAPSAAALPARDVFGEAARIKNAGTTDAVNDLLDRVLPGAKASNCIHSVPVVLLLIAEVGADRLGCIARLRRNETEQGGDIPWEEARRLATLPRHFQMPHGNGGP